MTWISFLLVLIVAFLAGMEGILDEFQFHQPLVACTLIGLVTGHATEGILLGGYLQMMALGWANVGAAVAPDVALASIASGILMAQGLSSTLNPDLVISASIGIAIPLSVIGLFLTKICRTKAIGLVQKMDKKADQGDFKSIEHLQILGICMQGLRVMIVALVLLLIPQSWIVQAYQAIPLFVLEGLHVASGMIPALGFAIVINVLASKETWAFFAIGFCMACISSLTFIGLALLGAGMMLIYMTLKKGQEGAQEIQLDPSLLETERKDR